MMQAELDGYGMTVTLANGMLRVVANNFAARGALGASERSIPVAEITAVEYTAPTLLKNGSVVVQSAVGKTVIHFLRKRAEVGRALYEALLASSAASADAAVTAGFANERRDDFEVRAAERTRIVKARLAERDAQRREALRRAHAEVEAARAAQREAHAQLKASWRGVIHSTDSVRVAELTALLDKAQAPESFDVTAEIAAIDRQIASTAAGRPHTATDLATFALQEAEAAADMGDIAHEEEMILAARAVARGAERAERQDISAQIDQHISDGRLRRGATLLGTIRSEGGITRWLRTSAVSAGGLGEKWIEIWSDRVVTASVAYAISAETSAQVHLDGQEFVTQRPTLTRMALLAPLPGSALLPGLAVQKREVQDKRFAEVQIRDVNWALRAAIPPADLSTPRQLAEQVNAIASRIARTSGTPVETTDLLPQLERLAVLIDKGVISDEEAQAIKTAMLEPRS